MDEQIREAGQQTLGEEQTERIEEGLAELERVERYLSADSVNDVDTTKQRAGKLEWRVRLLDQSSRDGAVHR